MKPSGLYKRITETKSLWGFIFVQREFPLVPSFVLGIVASQASKSRPQRVLYIWEGVAMGEGIVFRVSIDASDLDCYDSRKWLFASLSNHAWLANQARGW